MPLHSSRSQRRGHNLRLQRASARKRLRSNFDLSGKGNGKFLSREKQREHETRKAHARKSQRASNEVALSYPKRAKKGRAFMLRCPRILHEPILNDMRLNHPKCEKFCKKSFFSKKRGALRLPHLHKRRLIMARSYYSCTPSSIREGSSCTEERGSRARSSAMRSEYCRFSNPSSAARSMTGASFHKASSR